MSPVQNKRSKSRKSFPPREGNEGFPDRLRKPECIYIDGTIQSMAHGIYHVNLENQLNVIATARKMEQLRVGLLEGDKVVVEIPAAALNPNEAHQRGRILWRYKVKKPN